MVWYCCKECQVGHYPAHKRVCSAVAAPSPPLPPRRWRRGGAGRGGVRSASPLLPPAIAGGGAGRGGAGLGAVRLPSFATTAAPPSQPEAAWRVGALEARPARRGAIR